MEDILTAHRGLTLSSPQVENTLEAIKAAIDNPQIGAIEIDVQQTKDGVFVLCNYKTIEGIVARHDPDRLTIGDYTYDELCQLSFTPNMAEIKHIIETNGSEYGAHAPEVLNWCKEVITKQSMVTTLGEVLKLDRKGKPLFIEIKTDYKAEQKSEIAEYSRSLTSVVQGSDNIYFIGRDINTLLKLKEEKQEVPIMPVIGRTGIENAVIETDGVSAAWDALRKKVPGTNKELGELVLERGMGLAIWNILLQSEYDQIPDYVKNNTGAYLTGNFPELIGQYKSRR